MWEALSVSKCSRTRVEKCRPHMQTYKPHANETRHAGIGSNAKQVAYLKGRKN